MAKGLKLKVKRFYGLVPTFAEVIGERLVGGGGFVPRKRFCLQLVFMNGQRKYLL